MLRAMHSLTANLEVYDSRLPHRVAVEVLVHNRPEEFPLPRSLRADVGCDVLCAIHVHHFRAYVMRLA